MYAHKHKHVSCPAFHLTGLKWPPICC